MEGKQILEFIGELKEVSDVNVITEKFKKIDFAVGTSGDYPQLITFQLHNQNIGIIEKFNLGDKIRVFFNLQGRKYNDKVYNTLSCFKIEKV